MDKAYQEVIEYCTSKQTRYDQPERITPPKIKAKMRGAALLDIQEGWRILDIGGEDFYLEFFPGMEQLNLPDNMHDMEYEEEFNAVVAMHVLEHSPAPMVVLRKVYHALKPGGFLYVAAPRASEFMEQDKWGHFTVLSPLGWAKIIVGAGFDILHQEKGTFGKYAAAIEDRFLCQKK